MTALQVTKIPIRDEQRRTSAYVEIALLPERNSNYLIPPLIELEQGETVDGMPEVQLLEGCEYRYAFMSEVNAGGKIATDHTDVFQPDTSDGGTGRVRPGLYTGTLPVRVFSGESELGSFSVEVRSRKLGYLDEYRWMVRDLADQMSEVVMNRFAPVVQQFRVDNTSDAKTLYQRFAFLKSLISGETFQAAISEIVRRPHVQWIDIHEPTHPSKGIKATSSFSRLISKGGSRCPWDHSIVSSIPTSIDRQRTEVTVDTTPNRFVRFALEQWRDIVAVISDLLESRVSNPAIDRGKREVRETLDYLDAVLAEDLFKEVGAIQEFPADNQVLHKREGYRDVFQAYIQFDVAAKLSWQGGEDVYGAGKRDVATLYEYWVFLKIAQVVSELCDSPFDFSELIEAKQNSLNVTLKKGIRRVLESTVERQGRQLSIELWFNRSFGKKSKQEGSWTQQMRPDYSIKIKPGKNEKSWFEPVFLHFDAKYRVSELTELFGGDDDSGKDESEQEESQERSISSAKREDLLKMHAYRDAIRRSAGAYVIYPGLEQCEYRQYHELLPGLGAFTLRPTEGGDPSGKISLMSFLEDVLEHIASQVTQHERGRYWIEEVYSDDYVAIARFPAVGFMQMPPADTLILLGYVKSQEHFDWIESCKKYNIRADSRTGSVGLGAKELACDFIFLSSPAIDRVMVAKVKGSPELKTQSEMEDLDYPDPSRLYYCYNLDFILDKCWANKIRSQEIERIRLKAIPIPGHPVALSWLAILRELSSS